MSTAALLRIPARCSTSVADHSGNARLAVSTASSTSCAPPLGTLPTTSSVAGLTTSISAPAAARRHSPPMSMAASTVLSLRLDGAQITLYVGGRPSSVKRRGAMTAIQSVEELAPRTEDEVREHLAAGKLVEGLQHMSPEYLKGM